MTLQLSTPFSMRNITDQNKNLSKVTYSVERGWSGDGIYNITENSTAVLGSAALYNKS
jgi:hypothetical protein